MNSLNGKDPTVQHHIRKNITLMIHQLNQEKKKGIQETQKEPI